MRSARPVEGVWHSLIRGVVINHMPIDTPDVHLAVALRQGWILAMPEWLRCADVTRAKRRLSASRRLPHDHNRPTRQLLPLPALTDRTAVCRYVIVAN